MRVSDARSYAREHDLGTAILLSIVGYGVVIGTFADAFPYPEVSLDTVNSMSHMIAVVNTAALITILYGWYSIRKGNVRQHKRAMLSAFSLILLFLVIYLFKIGGGGTKEFVGPTFVRNYIYLPMLAVHLILSIVSVPVVIYAVVLGLTHSPDELRNETPHKRVGRIAAFSWGLSLFLGVVTYFLLNHMYAWSYTG